ncbi:BAR-domain-containing protein [Phellopilus nigrolimitatus]|nr:BAR-domain-containing protein [Phellopilus nigrolimitatus]
MASKQLGKLRQWAGEVISSREKTQPSSDFAAMEQDMDVRKRGIERLHTASADYLEYISRKVHSDAIPGDDKMMYTEALGVVMIGHGEGLGDDSSLGRSLSSFGRARCRIAAIQNIFAVSFTDTFLAHLGRVKSELDDCATQRKKLESRRLAYDSANTKAQKVFKKEKDKKEAEEELDKAGLRYEEMAEDVRARMDAIRDNDAASRRELKNFLELETRFVEQYLEVLKEVKAEWLEPDYSMLERSSSTFSSTHNVSRTSTRSSDSKDFSGAKQAPPVPSRLNSHRSTHSMQSTNSNKISARSDDGENTDGKTTDPLPLSLSRRMSGKSSRTQSRPQSRQSKGRSRSESVTTTGSTVGGAMTDEESVKSSGKHKKSASGVASWVGGAMTSVIGRGKSRVPDKENFSALDDKDQDEHGGELELKRKRSRRLSNRSTKSNKSLNLKRSTQSGSGSEFAKDTQKKVMKALYDFSGGSDELSFTVGDEIIVVNEVLDDWWLGEVDGQRGLFPTNYAVVVKPTHIQSAIAKTKNASSSSILGLGQLARANNKFSYEDEESRRTLFDSTDSDFSADGGDEDSINDWQTFNNRHRSPSVQVHRTASDNHRLEPDFDAEHGDSYLDDNEFRKKLSSSLAMLDVQQPPSRSPGSAISVDPASSPVKRIPPPPPPRRGVANTGPQTGGPPPLPVRNLAPNRARSTSSVPHALSPPATEVRRAHSETNSPFESQSELSFDAVATTSTETKVNCRECSCEEFVDDPFRGQKYCAKCSHSHA